MDLNNIYKSFREIEEVISETRKIAYQTKIISIISIAISIAALFIRVMVR